MTETVTRIERLCSWCDKVAISQLTFRCKDGTVFVDFACSEHYNKYHQGYNESRMIDEQSNINADRG